MPRDNSYEQSELYKLMGETEVAATRFAASRLEYATVFVKIEDCDYPFQDLPEEIQVGFTHIGQPVERVKRMDMELAYNRAEMLFVPQEVGLHLSNNLCMLFSRIKNSSADLNKPQAVRQNLFYPQVLDPRGHSLIKPEKTNLMSSDLLYSLLRHVGVGIPTAPQRADWEAIQSTLQFSNRWTAVATDTLPIDAYTHLYVEERLDGRGYTGDEEIDDDLEESTSSHVTEITLGLDMATEPGAQPNETLKYVFLAEDPLSLPRFAGMLALPLEYESEFLGMQATMRVEDIHSQTMVLPTVALLRRLNDVIANARRQI